MTVYKGYQLKHTDGRVEVRTGRTVHYVARDEDEARRWVDGRAG